MPNEGATLNKAFVEGHPSLLYLTENNQSYAVAPHGSQAYNLCFEPVERGTFTLERELLDAECQYLHLIDKFTGDDIDLLRISQYSFEADTTDGFNRFALVLSPDDMPEEEPYPMRSTNAVPKLPSHGGTSGHIAYQQGQIYITAMANPAEGGKVNGKTVFTNVYNNGQTVTLAATANAHYTFTNWTKNGAVVSTNATYSFTVTGNASYTANFSAVPQYTVTISQSPANGGTISFGGKDNGEELLYDFDDNTMQGWTTLKGSSGNSPHNWMHCSSYTYSNYTGKGHNNSQGFVLSESYISGSTSGTGSAVYPDNYLVSPQVKLGGSIRFWATNPNDEYGAEHFGVAVSTDGNTDVNDFTIIREWTLSPISKASKTGNMRNITNGTWYEYTADLSAFSGMGYVAIRHFDCSDQWLLCIDDITIVEGEVKRQVYYWGENCTVTAAPNTNCQFVNWTEDGEPVSTNATYNFIVTADRTLVANYNQGILSGLFSVSDNSQVSFSQGNLQYQASTNTWQFAEHQYDYVGESNSNISQTYSGWIDLFGWGTSGYNHGAIAYQPWSTSYDNSDYYAYGSYAYNLFDQSGQADWGFNAISNGGNQENRGWRTLTKEEWLYVFNNRSTTSGIRYTKAIVNNVNGVILLPDNWIADYYTLNNINQSGADFGGNIITSVQWDMLEQHGAVFLPAAGYRYGTSVGNVGSHGSYWSASYSISYFPWYFYFYDSYLYTNSYSNYDVRHQGLSVRLVRSFQNCFFGISATPNPTEGGAVSGAGTYQPGDICTLTATPSAGYTFVNWTENGSVVSSNPTYTFTVTGDRNLVANFNQNGSGITQITALTNGWNWWSSYIELNGIEGLALLENSMGDNGVMVKSRDEGFVEQYDNNGSPLWYGPLSSIHNEQMYMIRTNADCAASLTGQLASPANHPVTINPGWNWIGYPNPQGVSVATAMSGFTPAANDVIKGRFNYTTYYNENGSSLWYGTLNSLEPGQGYMYQSKGNSVKTLTFNTGRGEDAPSNVTTTGNVFQPQSSGYANTMTVTAVVDVDGEELRSERYELAAFCGDECRGSVKLMWIAPLNRYVAFLTVFGDTGDGITFRLTDGAGMATAAERCAFTADGALGTLTQPFTLRFGTLGVGEDNVASVMVFPNPVEKGQPFRVDLPESFGNATVEVVDVMGRVIGVYVCAGRDDVHIVSTTAAPTIPAPTVPGVYTVRITGEQGQTQYGKIIVK